MKKKKYLAELDRFSVELALLQRWVRETGQRIVILFEGRDAAGKGGIIKAIMRSVSPRVFRVVALPKPTDREKTQLYFQRYMAQMPAAGEVILFDRSWYNRAMVEPVMGFCTPEQTERFLHLTPGFESYLVDSGIVLLKYWLEISSDEQARQLQQRIDDPAKRWKLSGIDIEGRRRWYAYSRARDRMLEFTDTDQAPWHIVPSDDKRKARLNCISHMLSQIPYEEIPRPAAELPARDESNGYDDLASLANRRIVPDLF